MIGKSHFALFGNTKLIRVYCKDCECDTFVNKGIMLCCGKPSNEKPTIYIQESIPRKKRKLPHLSQRKIQLSNQENKCFYCDREFGSYISRKGKLIQLKINWDHLIPFSVSRDNSINNFVAACQVCNKLKSSFMFDSIDMAKEYISKKREQKGFIFIDVH